MCATISCRVSMRSFSSLFPRFPWCCVWCLWCASCAGLFSRRLRGVERWTREICRSQLRYQRGGVGDRAQADGREDTYLRPKSMHIIATD